MLSTRTKLESSLMDAMRERSNAQAEARHLRDFIVALEELFPGIKELRVDGIDEPRWDGFKLSWALAGVKNHADERAALEARIAEEEALVSRIVNGTSVEPKPITKADANLIAPISSTALDAALGLNTVAKPKRKRKKASANGRVSPEVHTQMRAMRLANKSLREIAEATGFSSPTVLAHVKDLPKGGS